MNSRPTLRSVAALAGVSSATASKALAGLPVSSENLAKVKSAADELGYVANSAARSMRVSETMTIGIVMNMGVHPGTELMRILQSTIEDLEQRGYTILLSVGGRHEAEVDLALRRLVERRVDGLFFWNAQPVESLKLYRSTKIPVFAVGWRDPACSDLPLITVDTTAACRQAAEALRGLGHRVVAEFRGPDDAPMPAIMEEAAAAAGLEYRRPPVEFEQEQVNRYLAEIAEAPDRPTVLTTHYSSVLQVISACELAGLRIPEDISILSTTDSEGAALLKTPVTALATDYSLLGHASASAMLRAIDGERPEDVLVEDSVWLVERASFGPVPPAAGGRGRRPSAVRARR